MIKDMKQQFSGLLYDIGFLESSNPKASSANYNSGEHCLSSYRDIEHVLREFQANYLRRSESYGWS